MTISEAIECRHSVRRYVDKSIESEKRDAILKEIERINAESGLHFQVFFDEPEAFQGNSTGYGSFTGCCNYFALVGKKGNDEEIGYFGEQLVLFAQSIGLNTCWVALTYKKGKVVVDSGKDEKLYVVVALGYGETEGHVRKSKKLEDVSDCTSDSPDWYKKGLEYALMAPTAINQQKFKFSRKDNVVVAKAGLGFYATMDLGIVKYHFEVGAGKDNFIWG